VTSSTRYFTFFLCTRSWPDPPVLTAWIESALERLAGSRRSAKVSGAFLPGQPAVEGSYDRNRDFLQKSPTNVTLTTGLRGGLFDFYLFLELKRAQSTPDYLRYLDPRREPFSEDVDAAKIGSLAVPLAAFRALGSEARAQVVSAIEGLFVEANALYACGRTTSLPISSPYALSESSPGSAPRRLIDFDYRYHIEDLFELNWLSADHRARIREPERLQELPDTPTRVVPRTGEAPPGLFIDASGSGSDSRTVLRQCLRDLLSHEEPRRKASLLVPRRQLEAVGSASLEELFPRVLVHRPSDDFIVLEGIEEAAAANPLEFERSLESFYRKARGPGRAREHLVEYSGLRDRAHSFYRFPEIDALDSEVRLRLTVRVELSRLPVLWILSQEPGASVKEEVEKIASRWQDAVRAHPAVYGRLRWTTPMRWNDAYGSPCLEGLLDASELRQEAIHLLVLLLDQANERQLRIRYVVLGDFPATATAR
jgi:hypothetical protein